MKFGIDVIPLETTSCSHFSFPTFGSTNVAIAQICEVGR
jgi:hypothetical protein